MWNIEVDFDVFKELIRLRPTENVSYSDVLRGLLGLGSRKIPVTSAQVSGHGGFMTRGVCLPNDTELRADYKRQRYYAKIEDGVIVMDNKHFSSPSAAAKKITGNSVNGRNFWKCCMPGKNSWQTINSLTKEPEVVEL